MKSEAIELQLKDEQVQNKSVVDKLFFCILMSITFLVYCFIYLATAPISAWEKSYHFLNKDSHSGF